MLDLDAFRKTIRQYYRQKYKPDGRKYTQLDLANKLILNEDELGKRLSGYRDKKTGRVWRLTEENALDIVLALAEWEALTWEQAVQLLTFIEYPLDSSRWKTKLQKYLQPPAQSVQNTSVTDANVLREKNLYLRRILTNHRDVLQNLLNSFVGRAEELADLQQRIEQKMMTGGYVTITGQAGQGKSSIIAKLIELYGLENVVFHFIPFKPGPDHQVGVLRNIMAQLILKYDLSDIYVTGERRAILRDFFPHLLEDIAAKEAREIIFIDGLDQLEVDDNDRRDLSFLPNYIPPGIVCVLGTRPNDTLAPLELLQPQDGYCLPNLSRDDFDLLLLHHHVSLDRMQADQFYVAMQKNALYLDLVAKELHERGIRSPEEMLPLLVNNPIHIFELTIERLEQPETQWREVLKPILGVLLAAREPLSSEQIRHILNIDHRRVSKALLRLGGLLNVSSDNRYSLFHLQFQRYLRQDEQQPQKDYILAADEEEQEHMRLATWCEHGGLPLIWEETTVDSEQGRRKYAQQHYLTHLSLSKQWARLFEVLDEGQYGRAKVRADPSMHGYVRDLDLGRKAAGWKGWTLAEKIGHLPRLWSYTLLRCSLTSRVDAYLDSTFASLLLLNHDMEAVRCAGLLTDPIHKAHILLLISGFFIAQPGRRVEGLQLLEQVYVNIKSIPGSSKRDEVLSELGQALAQANLWQQAQEVMASIQNHAARAEAFRGLEQARVHADPLNALEQVLTLTFTKRQIQTNIGFPISIDGIERAWTLSEVGEALLQAKHWQQAQEVIASIQDSIWKANGLSEVGLALLQAKSWQQVQKVIASIENSSRTVEVWDVLGEALMQVEHWQLAQQVIASIPDSERRAWALSELGMAMMFAKHWQQAQEVMASIQDNSARAYMLSVLVQELVEAEHWQQAQEAILSIPDNHYGAKAVRTLGKALIKTEHWQQAREVIALVKNSFERAEALSALGQALAVANYQQQAIQVWRQAQEVIASMQESSARTEALITLGQALTKAKHWQQAQEVIASIENSSTKAWALSALGQALLQANLWQQAAEVWQKAQEAIATIPYNSKRDDALHALKQVIAQTEHRQQTRDSKTRSEAGSALGQASATANHQQQIQEVIAFIQDSKTRARVLRALEQALARAEHWQQAQDVLTSIENSSERAKVWNGLGHILMQVWQKALKANTTTQHEIPQEVDSAKKIINEHLQLLYFLQHVWMHLSTYDEALSGLSLAHGLILLKPELGSAFFQSFSWAEAFLRGETETSP